MEKVNEIKRDELKKKLLIGGIVGALAITPSFATDLIFNPFTQKPDLITNPYEIIGITIDGGGTELTTGSKGFREIQSNCIVESWTLLSKESGSIVIDVKKTTYASFPTSSSISGTEKPTLSSAQKNQDLSLTTWSNVLSSGDILEFNVDSITTITRATLYLKIKKL